MRSRILIVSALIGGAFAAAPGAGPENAPAQPPARVWKADRAHSSIQFRVPHLGTDVIGWFEEYDIRVRAGAKDLSDAEVHATVRPGSVRMPNMGMAANLVAFFAPADWPEVTFRSTRLRLEEGFEYDLTGEFTMKGITREVTWRVKFNGPFEAPSVGSPGFTATTRIDRTAFGLGDEETLHDGQLVVGRFVEITCNIRLEAE